jgi:hypothetical protein
MTDNFKQFQIYFIIRFTCNSQASKKTYDQYGDCSNANHGYQYLINRKYKYIPNVLTQILEIDLEEKVWQYLTGSLLKIKEGSNLTLEVQREKIRSTNRIETVIAKVTIPVLEENNLKSSSSILKPLDLKTVDYSDFTKMIEAVSDAGDRSLIKESIGWKPQPF